MATNPIGQGTKTIGINMKLELAEEIEQRAKSMNISTGAYCKLILSQWLENGEGLKLEESTRDESSTMPQDTTLSAPNMDSTAFDADEYVVVNDASFDPIADGSATVEDKNHSEEKPVHSRWVLIGLGIAIGVAGVVVAFLSRR